MHCCVDRIRLLGNVQGAETSPTQPEPGEEVITAIHDTGIARARVAAERGSEGRGPFGRLVIRNVTIIDGTGKPPYGPAHVAIEQDRIAAISTDDRGESARLGEQVELLEGEGLTLLPGLVDSHAHFDSLIPTASGTLTDPQYILKLWLSHGVTTVRDVGALAGLEWTLEHKRRSAVGRITAPRMVVYSLFPQIEAVNAPDRAREWVRRVHEKGADGVKFILDPQTRAEWKIPMAGKVVGVSAEVHRAAIEEARTLGMGIAVHHGCTQPLNPLDSARLGITSIEHDVGIENEFGIPGALGQDVEHRAPRSDWAAGDLPPKWDEVMGELIRLEVTLVPTYSVMEARRDFMRARRAEWHDEYTMPYLARAFLPNPKIHGSSYLDWTTADEIRWQHAFRASMRFVREFHAAGGRVAAGSDAGFMYNLYGFGMIRELELLQEAGLSPMQVLQAATRTGARLLGLGDETGTIEIGKKADLVLTAGNPLDNLKVLYGTRHLRYDERSGEAIRAGGVRYTIKDGIVWDAQQLLADVRELVAVERAQAAEGEHG